MLLSPIPPTIPEIIVPAMHIPDGFLSLAISIVFWLVTIILLAMS